MSSSQLHVLAVVAIATCWGIFALTWLAGAAYNAFRGPTKRTRSNYQYAMVIGCAIVLVIFAVVPSSDWHVLEAETLWVSLVGLAILIGSTLLTLWARLSLGTMWSRDPAVKQHHELRTDGPYGITRHPIYTGMLGMLLGSVLMAGVGRWVVVFPVLVVLFEIKLHIEERLMTTTFPDDYPRYRQQVPQLVPALRLVRRRHAPDV
jgi:protein-S-isoprenylcysteine O-methyltransferase Ste14